jgi:hypothetical protein
MCEEDFLYRKLFYAISVALIIASFGAVVMAEDLSTKSERTMQLTIYTDPIADRTIKRIDMPPTGNSLGDAFYFNGPLRSENATSGPIIGELYGITTVVKMSPSASEPEQRMSKLFYTFNNSTDRIVVESITDYLPKLSTLKTNQTVVRAIVGGTGKYLGVRGQDAGTRNPDGSYTHVLTIVS